MFLETILFTSTIISTDLSLDQALPDTAIALIETDNYNDTANSLESMGLCLSLIHI